MLLGGVLDRGACGESLALSLWARGCDSMTVSLLAKAGELVLRDG